MAEVRVSKSHDYTPEEAMEKIKPFEDMLKKFGVKAKWKGQRADLKGTGVSGSIDVTASNVTVVVKLGMLAKAAGVDAARLKKSIEKRLTAALSEKSDDDE